MTKNRKPILDVLQRNQPERVPFWLMRQAGRYLPEYRALRANAGGFLDLVYAPEKAAEVTIQPLRRFGMDAAILFSDILIVPHALGQSLRFEAGEGPVLEPVCGEADLKRLSFKNFDLQCTPVYETVSRVSSMLSEEGFHETALIGFCGSPWTVICYMVEGRGSRDFEKARHWALSDPASFEKLIDIVTQASILYLTSQVKAGAEVIQLFESWGGLLDQDQFQRWVIEPTRRIVKHLKSDFPELPVIGFPRGAGTLIKDYAAKTGIDAVGLDHTVDLNWAAQNIDIPVQGNLDPVRLLAGGESLSQGMENIYGALKAKPFIFNLGHGVIKETSIENVQSLSSIVKGWTV
jgi:uroporphyrinogen decarboxylase